MNANFNSNRKPRNGARLNGEKREEQICRFFALVSPHSLANQLENVIQAAEKLISRYFSSSFSFSFWLPTVSENTFFKFKKLCFGRYEGACEEMKLQFFDFFESSQKSQ